MLFLAALFFASAFADFSTFAVFNSDDCSGGAIVYTTVSVSAGCVDISCVGGAGYSTETACTTDAPDLPGGLVGWTEYDSADCTGNVVSVSGYTSGCIGYGSLSYSTNCVGAGLEAVSYTNGDCSGSGSSSGVYEAGCISAGSRSILQSSCDDDGADFSVDWQGYLTTFLGKVGQSWVIPTFSATTFYSNHGTWENGASSASVVITFTETVDGDDITLFVNSVCSDVRENADSGVCDEATATECLSNPNSVSITCTWTVATSKRADSASSINFNAQMSNGVALTGLFALCLSLMVLLF
jgi:hypothetical protein